MNNPGPEDAFIRKACNALRRRHPAWRTALNAIDDRPHIRRRTGGYPGLFRIIVEQQVSVPSAQAILKRCTEQLPDLHHHTICELSDEQLRACGLSGPKIKYVRGIAETTRAGDFDFTELAKLSDAEAMEVMCSLKGVGPWTAAIYLLFCDMRMDIWPRNDVALLAAWTAAAGLDERPPLAEFDDMAEAGLAPYRGIAAHVLWTYYAWLRGRAPI